VIVSPPEPPTMFSTSPPTLSRVPQPSVVWQSVGLFPSSATPPFATVTAAVFSE
jgi:hypothetical protein